MLGAGSAVDASETPERDQQAGEAGPEGPCHRCKELEQEMEDQSELGLLPRSAVLLSCWCNSNAVLHLPVLLNHLASQRLPFET